VCEPSTRPHGDAAVGDRVVEARSETFAVACRHQAEARAQRGLGGADGREHGLFRVQQQLAIDARRQAEPPRLVEEAVGEVGARGVLSGVQRREEEQRLSDGGRAG